ncbi:MAG: DUF433 domain-containing protein [Armatimonadetes bacterium]|nr:DUF433 domain-containing protein [Armatimonadota bacterium]
MQAVAVSHIWLDEQGVAWIDETNTKVIEVALDKIAYGWTAEEIHEQHPYLSLAQIHAALTYYYDHRDAMDRKIAADRREREIEALARAEPESPFAKRVREASLRP